MKAKSCLAVALVSIPWVVSLAGASQSTDDFAARRKAIAEMSPIDKQQLLRNQERFGALRPDQQRRLRQLEQDLEVDKAEGAKLRQVMFRYHAWLAGLPPGQRAEVLEKPASDRLALVKKLTQEQARLAAESPQEVWPLTPEDVKTIMKWTEDQVWSRREELYKHLELRERKRIGARGEVEQRRALVVAAVRHSQLGPLLWPANQQSLHDLLTQLSPPAQQRIQATKGQERQQQVRQMVRSAVHIRMKQIGGRMPLGTPEELERFFAHELTADERERLSSLSAEEMQRELRILYFQHQGEDARPLRLNRPNRNQKALPVGSPRTSLAPRAAVGG